MVAEIFERGREGDAVCGRSAFEGVFAHFRGAFQHGCGVHCGRPCEGIGRHASGGERDGREVRVAHGQGVRVGDVCVLRQGQFLKGKATCKCAATDGCKPGACREVGFRDAAAGKCVGAYFFKLRAEIEGGEGGAAGKCAFAYRGDARRVDGGQGRIAGKASRRHGCSGRQSDGREGRTAREGALAERGRSGVGCEQLRAAGESSGPYGAHRGGIAVDHLRLPASNSCGSVAAGKRRMPCRASPS